MQPGDTGLQEGLQVDYVIRGRVAAAAGGRLTIVQPILCHSRESREPNHQPARLQLIHSSERRGATYFQFKICCKFIQRWHKMCCCKCCKGSRHKLETGNLTSLETRSDHQKWVQPAFQEKNLGAVSILFPRNLTTKLANSSWDYEITWWSRVIATWFNLCPDDDDNSCADTEYDDFNSPAVLTLKTMMMTDELVVWGDEAPEWRRE